MADKLTIVARIETLPGQQARVKSELLKLVEPTLREPGCLQYDLHQDNDDPTVFLFYENWQNRELWRSHMNSRHIADYTVAVEGAVASFKLNELSRI